MELNERGGMTYSSVWPEVTLRSLLVQPATYGIVKAGTFQSSGVLMLRSGDIKGGKIGRGLPFVTEEKSDEYSRTVLHANDVVIALVGYPGETAVVPNWLEGANISRAVGLLRPSANLDSKFLAAFLNSPIGRREFLKPGAGSAQLVVNLKDLNKLLVPKPHLAEQRAIAAALSDVDALISSLDALIAKKRAVKTAAMQQLLTGRQRLPGFSGEWKTMTLAQIGEIESSGVDKKLVEGEVPVRLVNYMDVYRRDWITTADLDHHVTAPANKASRCSVQKGDVFFTPSSEVREDIGHSAVALEDIPDAVYSYHVVRLRVRDPWDLKFRAYAFKSKSFLDQASLLCAGSGTRYVISKPQFKSMTVAVPPVDEQAAIAEILFDMDAEIAALEARRDKTRHIKTGMMQELLTGRTRLIPQPAE